MPKSITLMYQIFTNWTESRISRQLSTSISAIKLFIILSVKLSAKYFHVSLRHKYFVGVFIVPLRISTCTLCYIFVSNVHAIQSFSIPIIGFKQKQACRAAKVAFLMLSSQIAHRAYYDQINVASLSLTALHTFFCVHCLMPRASSHVSMISLTHSIQEKKASTARDHIAMRTNNLAHINRIQIDELCERIHTKSRT